jgi:hypothetical protein
MEHTRHAHRASLLRLALFSPLVFGQCAEYPGISDYDIHWNALATIDHVDYPAELHVRLEHGRFAGYYIVDLPDYRLRRTFTAGSIYYPVNSLYQGFSGTSECLNFQDSVNGTIAYIEANRGLQSFIIYDQLQWDTIPHFIGVRLQVPDTGIVLSTVQ